MEIGSLYEIDPAALRGMEAGREEGLRLAEIGKYGKRHVRYTASGREAIALALRGMEEHRPEIIKKCLLPAYMCDTVFFPFKRAGWEIGFYHVDRKLEADGKELRRLVEEVRPGLLFVHAYYGVDTVAPIRPFLLECRRQGICVMEDVTQSYYLEGIGREADYVVGSLRKWYAVPDGGFAASDERLPQGRLAMEESFTAERLELQKEKWAYLNSVRSLEERHALKEAFLRKNRETERWLDGYAGIRALSGEAAYLLKGMDEAACRDRRRDNHAFLYGQIQGMTQAVPILGKGKGDTAPLYLAVYAPQREALQRFLGKEDIYAPVLWPLGKENQDCLTGEERYIYDHMLALPVDQRYGREDMERVAEALRLFERRALEKELIGIRTDANDTVASGHVMRCITIAKRLLMAGRRVLFFTADDHARDMLCQAGMEYVCLHSDWRRMEEETGTLREELQARGCRKLLVDSYQVTQGYFERLRDVCRIAYIDDCFEEVWPVDLVIDYNAYHVRFPYARAYAGRAKLLLGTAYVPLREEFSREGRKNERAGEGCRPEAFHVLLSSGGGDRQHVLTGILSRALDDPEPKGNKGMENWEEVIFHAVVGGFHGDRQELDRLAEDHPNICLHHQVSHMAELMEGCDAAVSAAGTMLFELSAMQIPTVFFVSADNQQHDREFFGEEERMLFAGDIRKDREECLGRILSGVARLRKDGALRERMRAALGKVTDGQGAERIAQELIRLPERKRCAGRTDGSQT